MVHLRAAAIVVFKGPVQHCRVRKPLSFQPPYTVKVFLLVNKGFLLFSFRALADAFDWVLVLAHQGNALCKTKAGFTQPATEKAMKFYIGLQQNDWCPDQTYFAETAPGTAFFSEKGAMFLEGDWNILAELQNYPELVGKWDVAVLPKCPDPESGDGRATISNGLCYATAASNKNLDTVKDILKFFGSEEGQRIQGESGAAIPAYQGLEDTWAGCFAEYPINIQCFIEMFEYSIQSVNNASRPEWKSKVSDELLKIYAGTEDIETGLQKMQDIVDQASAG